MAVSFGTRDWCSKSAIREDEEGKQQLQETVGLDPVVCKATNEASPWGICVLVFTCASSRLVSSRLHLPTLKSPSRSPLSPPSSSTPGLLIGFVGYPRKYDASVFRAAGSYRDVHEMADADADAPTDSSGQKKDYFVYTIPREHEPVLLKASYVDMLVLLLGRVPWRYNVGGGGCAPSYRIRCLGLLLLFAQ
ncbi:hypothetical protein MRB53_003966 [Persea americana]|uniref:Uncharacterized protein n=1 Tax=Persea americana TaxID=3435 RepID=A0ACC2MZI8_PERAE|nr:hypothetical protein MRB53_003966 [Persea americana]